MKDYKRLTERDEFGNADIIGLDSNELASNLDFDGLNKLTSALNKFSDLEDKIESGELCDREEVRKETAREILDKVYKAVESARLNSEYQDKKRKWVIDEYEFMSEFTLGDLHNLYKEYGIDLFGKTEQVGNSDKLEDEE